MLSFTPRDSLTDGRGRPYFLWDCDLTLDQFREALRHADPEVRSYFVGKVMRQAKPDDVLQFVTPRTIRDLWPLKSFDPRPLALALGWSDAETARLEAFRVWLLNRLTSLSAPE
jgi:hypothetical protein